VTWSPERSPFASCTCLLDEVARAFAKCTIWILVAGDPFRSMTTLNGLAHSGLFVNFSFHGSKTTIEDSSEPGAKRVLDDAEGRFGVRLGFASTKVGVTGDTRRSPASFFVGDGVVAAEAAGRFLTGVPLRGGFGALFLFFWLVAVADEGFLGALSMVSVEA
jgi:hypothetical protein